jgi:hypothetical protein
MTTSPQIYDVHGSEYIYEPVRSIIENEKDPGMVLLVGSKVFRDDFRSDLCSEYVKDFGEKRGEEIFKNKSARLGSFGDEVSLGNQKQTDIVITSIREHSKTITEHVDKLPIRMILALWPEWDEDLKYLPKLVAAHPQIPVYILQQNFTDEDGHFHETGVFPRVTTEEVKELESATLDEVESEAIDWIDDGYLPRGMTVTVFAPKGRGKTKVMDWFTARATKRDEIVVRFNLEDPVESVLKPALHAAGADLTKVIWIKPQPLDLSNPLGIAAVRAKIIKVKATLVIFEPLNNYKGSAKSISEDDMRPIYMGLSTVAKETGCCIVIINHANKKKDVDVLEKSLGAGSGPAVARANFFIEKNPDNENERILTDAGSNIPVGKSLVFTIEGKDFELDGVQHKNVGHAVFLRHSDVTGDELLEQVQTTKKGETNRVVEFLTEFLSGKGDVSVDTVKLAARNHNPDWTWDNIKQTWSRKKLGTTRTEGGGKNKKTYWTLNEAPECPMFADDGAPKY